MKTNPKKTLKRRGFALIVTLSLMILLTVVAVGLLSLSSISLRAASQSSAATVARNNARLAMMLALGELQTSMGPDRSVSAPASAVFSTAKRPRLMGAWTSTDSADYWHWGPTPSGSPNYSSKKDRFSRWLISTPKPSDATTFSFASTADPTGVDAVTLVGSSTALPDSQNLSTTVIGGKVKVTGSGSQISKYGWAVFDESMKASIDLGEPTTRQPTGVEVASRSVPNRFRADPLDSKLSSLKDPVNLISLETASIPDGSGNNPEFRKRFHDFTTGSVGLLTNTADGGLKTDLTALFEPATLPSGAFTSVTPYPAAFNVASGAPRWSYLREHYRKYKNVVSASGGELSYSLLTSLAKDLKINSTPGGINPGDPPGLSPSPDTERLLPVIAKFQLVFSLVTHRHTFPGRTPYWDGKLGVNGYGVPHLVYDPVITLYNPYDVSLNLAKSRIRIWDPPVGFRLTKIDKTAGTSAPFRDPSGTGVIPGSGGFTSLAQMQIDKQSDPTARKCFTLQLTDGNSETSTNTLKLKPGEVKVFSARVQKTWDWAWETTNGPNVFFDYNAGLNFGNIDRRSTGGVGDYGVEAVPGWSFRAGLQIDHLAQSNPRYGPSKYALESGNNDGFVTMRSNDEITLEIKPMVASATASKQFEVDVLAGSVTGNSSFDATNSGVKGDTLRSYSFFFTGTDPSADMSEDPNNPIIKSVNYTIGELMQENSDRGKGGKKAIAMLEMSARTTKERLTDSKPWLYNNPVVEGADQNTDVIGLSHQAYDLRLFPLTSLDGFPGGIAVDSQTNRGYFGANGGLPEGSSFVPMLHVPATPTASLGDLIPTNLASGSQLPRVVHPFGNSRAHPLIPSDKVATGTGTVMMDHSYLLNDGLWDSYYFSTVANYDGGGSKLLPVTRTIDGVLKGVLKGSEPALNTRLVAATQGNPDVLADKVLLLTDLERSRQLAKYVGVKGPFNVNSTSLDAWCAVLFSLRDREVNGVQVRVTGTPPTVTTTLSNTAYSNSGSTPFVRTGKPLAGSGGASPGMLWAGFKTLTDNEITGLAKQIIVEIKKRGVSDTAPPFSLAEFVNRRPGSSVHGTAGLLQTAIDNSNINDAAITRDSKPVSAASISAKRKIGVQTTSVMDGNSAEGAPSMLTQGDLMTALAPVATVRGDTFKIRSYGEALTPDGKTIVARAWCETVVQRVPDFVDPKETPETTLVSLNSVANKKFGRRFNIVSFRWLNDKEL